MSKAGLEAIRYILETHIMFSVLPQQGKLALQPLFELLQFEPEDVIAKQDTAVEGMYVIYSGEVRLKQWLDGKIISLGLMAQGGTLGEMSMIQPTAWQHSVVATEKTTVLFLPADKVGEIIAVDKVMEEHFKSHVSLIEIGYRLKGLLGKARYTPSELIDVLRKLGVKNVPAGGAVYSQGDEDPRLYYVAKGRVELISDSIAAEEDPILLDRVEDGGVIGESGAIAETGRGGIQPHSALAIEDATLLVIRQSEVAKLLEINPGLRDDLIGRARQLMEYEREELAARNRAEGVDLRIKLADAVTEDEFRAMESSEDITDFPVVNQGDDTEAAAACLTMISKHYGKELTLGQIRELTGLSGVTVTPNEIYSGAEQLGYRAKGYNLKYDDLKTVKLPAIIGWETHHYVVLFQVSAFEVQIADPALGLRTLKKEEFLPSWSPAEVPGVGKSPDPEAGVLIALEPTQRFERQEAPKRPIQHFINYILPHKKYFGEAIIAALTINLLGLASPLFVQTIVDSVVVHHDVSLLNMMLGGMVLVTVFTTLVTMAQSLLLGHTTARIDMRMMSEFYAHVLSLPMDFFLKRNKGEILTRFGENQKIRAIIAGSTITVLLNTLMVAIYFAMMFLYNFTLAVVVIVFIPIYIAIVLYFTPRIKAIAQEIFLTNAQSQAYLIESINGIESLKATANEYMARARWENAFAENVNRSFRQVKLNLMSSSLFKLATLASTIFVLWIGATDVINGNMTIGELMGFNMLMGLVTAPVLQMVNLWNDLQEVRISVERVSDVLNVDPEQEPVTDPMKLPATLSNCQGRIDFKKVNFSYVANEQTNYVMREFDLTIEPGQRVAFVGPSGCGKSTIAKMILGFNIPAGGECTIDGKDITSLDLRSLRRNIGVVLQDSFIFSGTVAENIALGEPDPDMQKVKEAARLAGADDFIINYPLGYQTAIGEKGMGISGGQRQRICIARAIYHKPKIIIFDEATSALDNESEERIMEALDQILHNRTSIMIAHRLSTIIDCDQICYIRDGKVQEKGSHQELLDKEYLKANGYTGMYYQLAQGQFDLPDLDLS